MIRLAVIEDNRLVRDGLTALLTRKADLSVAYSAPNADLERLKEVDPRVVLLDVGLEGEDSLGVAERVRSELPEARVVVMDLLPVHEELVDFVNAGVSGFVMKDATLADLLRTIRSVAAGQNVLPPQMTSSLFSQIAEYAVLRGRTAVSADAHLTPREREVVELIGDGLSNKAIARGLGLSPHTVKSHVRNIMDKLALHTRLQIAAFLHATEEDHA